MAKQKPNAGVKNLIPIRDTETARARGKQGGIRSAEAKKERKFISAIYAEMLAKEFTVDINEVPTKLTGTGLLEHTIKTALATGGSPAVAMIKEMREATEGTKAMMTVDNVIEIKHTFDPDGV